MLLHPALTQPVGIRILEPTQRVSRAELERRDARYRAYRERAHARSWSEDATLVGSIRSYGTNGSSRRRRRGRFARIQMAVRREMDRVQSPPQQQQQQHSPTQQQQQHRESSSSTLQRRESFETLTMATAWRTMNALSDAPPTAISPSSSSAQQRSTTPFPRSSLSPPPPSNVIASNRVQDETNQQQHNLAGNAGPPHRSRRISLQGVFRRFF